MLGLFCIGRTRNLVEKSLNEKIKKISTLLLTVLTTSVIVRLEQRKKRNFTSRSFCSERMLALE